MTWWQAILLGIVQGLTEFLPVSSSAHLALVPHWLGWELTRSQVFVFDVLVQWGTLFAVLVYFWQDWWAMARALGRWIRHPHPIREDPDLYLLWLVAWATVPAVALGWYLKDHVMTVFHQPQATGFFLLLTAVLMTLAELLGPRCRLAPDLTLFDALLIGLGQALALFPGVSRSGATMSVGLLRGLKQPEAARFSFLMSLPIMLAAGLVAMVEWIRMPGTHAFFWPLSLGFLSAMISGYLAIAWLLRYLARRRLWIFVLYCTILGLAVLWMG
ncbi:MAG: undecaprenyl-diphosphate phosphatase [Chloroflexi bacterium]|nr:undecaprenyl-diphosphate phosphatase [Chloroflexota bacterium]